MAKAKSRRRSVHASRADTPDKKQQLREETFEDSSDSQESEPNKISERLVALIRPDMSADTDIVMANMLMLMGGTGWNMAVEPEVGEQQREVLLASLPASAASDVSETLELIKERKQALFPDDLRLIVHTEVRQLSNGRFHFMASSLGAEDGSGRERITPNGG